ncbi:MAG: zf-HC2 domain-containing protein [Actinobacteria bacterium]|nr:zf-HC2 domain-containing protein [Actinomycetota bacterium]
MRAILPADCSRACQQLSLRMDSELSEFETVLLEAHLGRCADCRAFGQSLSGLTATLRAIQPERPMVSFQPPRRANRLEALLSGSLRAASAAAAFAVVAVTGLIALQGAPSPVRGVDIREAQAFMELHERRLVALDGLARTQVLAAVPRGLAAAENAGPTTARIAGSRPARLVPGTHRNPGRR